MSELPDDVCLCIVGCIPEEGIHAEFCPCRLCRPDEIRRFSRRQILAGIAAGGAVIAGELWVPGQRLISIPKPQSGGFFSVLCDFTPLEVSVLLYPQYSPGNFMRHKVKHRMRCREVIGIGDAVTINANGDVVKLPGDSHAAYPEDSAIGIALTASEPLT